MAVNNKIFRYLILYVITVRHVSKEKLHRLFIITINAIYVENKNVFKPLSQISQIKTFFFKKKIFFNKKITLTIFKIKKKVPKNKKKMFLN